jgi:hypothetical protein
MMCSRRVVIESRGLFLSAFLLLKQNSLTRGCGWSMKGFRKPNSRYWQGGMTCCCKLSVPEGAKRSI